MVIFRKQNRKFLYLNCYEKNLNLNIDNFDFKFYLDIKYFLLLDFIKLKISFDKNHSNGPADKPYSHIHIFTITKALMVNSLICLNRNPSVSSLNLALNHFKPFFYRWSLLKSKLHKLRYQQQKNYIESHKIAESIQKFNLSRKLQWMLNNLPKNMPTLRLHGNTCINEKQLVDSTRTIKILKCYNFPLLVSCCSLSK